MTLAPEKLGTALNFNSGEIARGSKAILKDLTLSIEYGEIVVVMGRSGVGKSTLLTTIFDTFSEQRKSSTPSIFYLEQRGAYLPYSTVEQNLAIALRARAGRPSETLQEISRLLGLTPFMRSYPEKLSGGERQRLSIACLLASAPSIALCDEPLSSIDEFGRFEIVCALRQYFKKQQMSVAYVTHSVEEGLLIGDRILVLRDGKIGAEYCNHLPDNRDPSLRWESDLRQSGREIYRLIASDSRE